MTETQKSLSKKSMLLLPPLHADCSLISHAPFLSLLSTLIAGADGGGDKTLLAIDTLIYHLREKIGNFHRGSAFLGSPTSA